VTDIFSRIVLTERQKSFLAQYIADVDLSVRTANCLTQLPIKQLVDLLSFTPEQLLRVPNLGKKSLNEIIELFAQQELSLGLQLLDVDDLGEVYPAALPKSGERCKGDKSNPPLTREQKAFLVQPITDYDFSARIAKYIRKAHFRRVADLAAISPGEFRKINSLGRSSLTEVQEFLESKGLSLGLPRLSEELLSAWEYELAEVISCLRNSQTIRPTAVDGKRIAYLEDELPEFVRVVLTRQAERAQRIVIQLFGLDGSGRKTLETVGKGFNITRERVRQIGADFARRARGKKVDLPILYRAADMLERSIPTLEADLHTDFRKHFISAVDFDCTGIIAALELVGRKTSLRVVTVGQVRIVGAERVVANLARTGGVTRSIVSGFGCGHIDHIIGDLDIPSNGQSTRNTIVKLLSAKPGIRWLDDEKEWFTIDDAKRNRLSNVIRKVLCVCREIRLSELRTAIKRVHRLEGFAPPREVLGEFCSGLSFCRRENDWIIATAQLAPKEHLGETELCFYEVLRKEGPVTHLTRFREACVSRGMNENTFYQYVTYSPIVARLAREVYALVGADVSPGAVDDAHRVCEPRPVIVDDGWSKDGRLWIIYRLTSANIRTGVFTIPAAYGALIAGEYFVQASGTGSRDRLVAENGRLSGLRRSTAIRGGEAGDLLMISFDLQRHQVDVTFPDESSSNGTPMEPAPAFIPPPIGIHDGFQVTRGSASVEAVDVEASTQWQPISTVPIGRNVEVQVADSLGRYALLFPCRLDPEVGWMNAWLSTRLTFEPIEWREWVENRV
jgi:hypothetical protein